ncbi:MAG: cobyric acid synthase [Nannocystaceae bacterium]
MSEAPCLMIQGTASSVGKSLLVAALCRHYARRGVRVAPFKAQNMALNAHVTPEGLEIGRAQALQARACGLAPNVLMNPILLKPEADARAQVVVLGKSRGRVGAQRYHLDKTALRHVVTASLDTLRNQYDLVVIEGAGSPAEINLREQDLVNMFVALFARAPVLLVGDIDRGGVFAHLVGTLALLDDADRSRIKGFVINKFRGDLRLLKPGLRQLEERTALPVIGVVPHVPRLRLGDEDSLSLDDRGPGRRAAAHELDIAVIRLPWISNSDDFDALAWEWGVALRFVRHPQELQGADLVVIPGSKSTFADLRWLEEGGLAEALRARGQRFEPILGICGGCQMLGRLLVDPHGVEGAAGTKVAGLGLLSVATEFSPVKRTERVTARSRSAMPLLGRFDAAQGYWIHAGRLRGPPSRGGLEVRGGGESTWVADGAVSGEWVVGTMVHGLLENEAPRRNLLERLALRRGLERPSGVPSLPSVETELDRWTDTVIESLDMGAIDRWIDP